MNAGLQAIRAALLAAFFTAGLALGCAVLRALAPFPRIPQVADKLALFATAEPAPDTLFFGSSKIYSGVVPELFDAAMAEKGRPVRAFNLGVDGMGFPESGFLCEQALKRRPGAVRWVLIEISSVRTYIPAGQRGTRRLTYWHDFQRTALVVRALLAGRSAGTSRADSPRELLATHGHQFARWCVNAGDGAELIAAALLPPAPPSGRDVIDPLRRGYFPITSLLRDKEVANYQRDLARFDDPARRERTDPLTEQALRDFAARVKQAGATAIFVVAPNPSPAPRYFAQRKPGDADAPEVFTFDDPARFPELYRVENRGDSVHLNDAGARAFTARLAERFAQSLARARD